MVDKSIIITMPSNYTEIYDLTRYFCWLFYLILETVMWDRWNYSYLNFTGKKMRLEGVKSYAQC